MKYKKGFTLIELMVSFAIMAVVSTVIIYNHQKFNDNLEITNLSYEVALALRQAQVYGVSARDFKEGINTPEAERFSTPYGIHFGATATGKNKDNTSFIFFADVADAFGVHDGKYVSGQDVILVKTDIGRGNYIFALCEQAGVSGGWFCDVTDGNGNIKRDKLDITFTRPDPDARFEFSTGVASQAVRVCLMSPQGREKQIDVYTTGQISIVNDSCLTYLTEEAGDPGDTRGPGNGLE